MSEYGKRKGDSKVSEAIAENIFYLTKFRHYDIDKVCENIGLTKGETAKLKNGHLKTLSVDVVMRAIHLFNTDFEDILYTDYKRLWASEVHEQTLKEDVG